MRTRNFSILLIITLFFSGCVVYSFYPLYTEKDLFPNDILIGEWMDDEGAHWNFEHRSLGKKNKGLVDSTSYYLVVSDKDSLVSKFNVHIVELGDHYFLDFYLDDMHGDDELDLGSFHIIPVHTFAKLKVENDRLLINWFDQEWLEDLIKENKIRIHHEKNEDYILLTAKPKELQKFVTKYAEVEEAFEDGMEALLTRN